MLLCLCVLWVCAWQRPFFVCMRKWIRCVLTLMCAHILQVCYFLLPDRFSDGAERVESRPCCGSSQHGHFSIDNKKVPAWNRHGECWQGGTLQGIKDELPYLRVQQFPFIQMLKPIQNHFDSFFFFFFLKNKAIRNHHSMDRSNL